MYVLYVCVYEKCVNKVASAIVNLLSTVLHECIMHVIYVCMYVLCMIVLYVCVYTLLVGESRPPAGAMMLMLFSNICWSICASCLRPVAVT